MTIYYRKDYDDPLSVNCGFTMHLSTRSAQFSHETWNRGEVKK